jgi:hypothetical protein
MRTTDFSDDPIELLHGLLSLQLQEERRFEP